MEENAAGSTPLTQTPPEQDPAGDSEERKKKRTEGCDTRNAKYITCIDYRCTMSNQKMLETDTTQQNETKEKAGSTHTEHFN
ncbi:hypothetical protein E2C01_076553 [Portunus trituberculatus]|uniref:Uncharacterized protein n=1 Tax=Portunus trituberculatus TaxID=210409 RepID=A0A5B7INW3_PORTR|nr:hypothetical protein [Portunus trituberculatus]